MERKSKCAKSTISVFTKNLGQRSSHLFLSKRLQDVLTVLRFIKLSILQEPQFPHPADTQLTGTEISIAGSWLILNFPTSKQEFPFQDTLESTNLQNLQLLMASDRWKKETSTKLKIFSTISLWNTVRSISIGAQKRFAISCFPKRMSSILTLSKMDRKSLISSLSTHCQAQCWKNAQITTRFWTLRIHTIMLLLQTGWKKELQTCLSSRSNMSLMCSTASTFCKTTLRCLRIFCSVSVTDVSITTSSTGAYTPSSQRKLESSLSDQDLDHYLELTRHSWKLEAAFITIK